MPFDNYKNFVLVTVPQGYEASDTSITLSPEDIARLPDPPFNLTWWDSTNYSTPSLDPNREIVRVTVTPEGTLVELQRAQENTTATDKNTPDAVYSMLAAATEKFFADLEAELATLASGDTALDARIDALEATDVTLDARLDAHDTTITALQAADVALDTRVDTLEAGGGPGTPSTQEIDVTAAPYNALGDGVEFLDGVSTAASTTLTSATANFTAADVGKRIWIEKVGPASGFGNEEYGGPAQRAPIVTTITSRVNATTITVGIAPQVALTELRFLYGSDDTAALQSAFDNLNNFGGNKLLFPAGRIFFTSGPLTIQRYNGDQNWRYGCTKSAVILISGYGARIMCHTNNNFIQMAPNTQESDFHTPIIEGLGFEGVAGPSQCAINLEWTFGCVIRDIRILRVGVGMDLRGMLHGHVKNCIIDYFSVYAMRLRTTTTGDIPTNVTVIEDVRVGPTSDALASFLLEDTDGCELRNCVSESSFPIAGGPFRADVIFETVTFAAYAHILRIVNFYSEVHPFAEAMFRIINDGSVTIESVHRFYDPIAPIIDVTGSVASTVRLKDCKVMDDWLQFKQDAANSVRWIFENVAEFVTGTQHDLTTSAFWVGGVVPADITHIEPGRIVTTSETPPLAGVELLMATVGEDDDSIVTLIFDQTVKAPDFAIGASFKVNGTARAITSATRQTDKTKVNYLLASPVVVGDTISFSYVAEDGFIESASTGLNLDSMTDHAVINMLSVVVLLRDTFTDVDTTLLPAHTMDVGPGWTAATLLRHMPSMQGEPLPEPRTGLPPRIMSNMVETRHDPSVAYDFTCNAGASDFIAEVDITYAWPNAVAPAEQSMCFLMIRRVDSNNGWYFGMSDLAAPSHNVNIYRNIAGSFSVIQSRVQTLVANTPYKLIVSAIGPNFEFRIAGTTMSFTDSTFQTATIVGLEFVNNFSTPIKVDNFRVIVP